MSNAYRNQISSFVDSLCQSLASFLKTAARGRNFWRANGTMVYGSRSITIHCRNWGKMAAYTVSQYLHT